MRYLLALLLIGPAFAQQADQQTKPGEQPAAQASAPADQKPADQKPADQKPPDQPADQKPADQKAAASPAPSTEAWITGSFDVGYRWVSDVAGSFLEYRSVVNLGSGPRLFGLDLTITDPKKRFFDTIHARGYNWGDPYNTAHVDIRKLGIYDFNFDYRSIIYFNAVPTFANPFLPAGFNEQSFDVDKRMTSFNFDLLPGKHVVPYLAFYRNYNFGHGIQTWVQEPNNEFPVASALRDSTNNYRGGLRFEFSRFHATVEQGGTTFKNDDQASFNGVNYGDNTSPIFGQKLVLNTLQQIYGIRGDSIYTKALVTASPTSWLNLYGQFLFSEPNVTVHYNDAATGNFLQNASLLFYMSEQTTATGAANAPHVTGIAGFELRPVKRTRVVGSWMTDRYHDAASPALAQTLLAGNQTVSLASALNYAQVVNYNQFQVEGFVDVTRKLTLRGGYRRVWGDSTVLAGQLSQSGMLAFGELQRNVALAGANYRATDKFSVNLDFEGASSDQIYFRTSLNTYYRGVARARYQWKPALAFQAGFRAFENQNPAPGIQLHQRSLDTSLAVYWTPKDGKRFSVIGEYDRATVFSRIDYLDLFFTPAVSIYRDNAHTASALVTVTPLASRPEAKLTFGGSLFLSSGSRPTNYYQPTVKLTVPIVKHVYWNSEWMYYGFGEPFYLFEGFRTHILQTGLRVTK